MTATLAIEVPLKRPTPQSEHLPQLDSVRALAVLGVLAAHWLPANWTYIIPIGTISVRVFFVLSGFLITGILLRSRQQAAASGAKWHSLRQFYVRRFLRIFPLFYAVLAVIAILDVPLVRQSFPWHLCYL